MAKSKKETVDKKNDKQQGTKRSFKISKQQKFVLGCLLVLFSIALLVAFISFYVNGQWQNDQSVVNQLGDRTEVAENWLGKFGAYLADLIIYRGFGLASFIFVRLFFLTGMFLALELSTQKLKNTWFWDIFAIIVVSVLFGFFATSAPELGGTIGYELNLFLQDYIGKTGTLLTLLFGLIVYLIFKIKLSPEKIQSYFDSTKKEIKSELDTLFDYAMVPRCIYTRPEAAAVGLTEQEAKAKGYDVKVGKFPFKAIGKALVFGEAEGFVKFIADRNTDDLLGVHMVGPHVTDLISEAGLARVLDAAPWEVAHAIHPHPTLSEALAEAALAVDGRAIHF